MGIMVKNVVTANREVLQFYAFKMQIVWGLRVSLHAFIGKMVSPKHNMKETWLNHGEIYTAHKILYQ